MASQELKDRVVEVLNLLIVGDPGTARKLLDTKVYCNFSPQMAITPDQSLPYPRIGVLEVLNALISTKEDPCRLVVHMNEGGMPYRVEIVPNTVEGSE